MKSLFQIIFLVGFTFTFSQNNLVLEEIAINKHIDGTIIQPMKVEKPVLAIIIAGSGPTDRNGNQNFAKSDNLKKLAYALAENNIASFRYDKRVVKQIRTGSVDENIMFDDFVKDARDVVTYFYNQNNYSKIIVIGHSQGSLIGILISNEKVDGLVSIAGAGQNIGNVLIDQVLKSAPMFSEDTNRIIGILKEGNTTADFPPALGSIFNLQTQKFLINWMQYNPSEAIKELNIPVLIINGTKDLQIPLSEAQKLKEGNPNAIYKEIENMNHVMFTIEGDDLENAKSYNETNRDISSELITSIVDFIKG